MLLLVVEELRLVVELLLVGFVVLELLLEVLVEYLLFVEVLLLLEEFLYLEFMLLFLVLYVLLATLLP